MEFQLVLRPSQRPIAGMKRARPDIENGKDIVPITSKKQKKEEAAEDLIHFAPKIPETKKRALVVAPMPSSKRLMMEETAPVLTPFAFSYPSPIRSHPPSPLQFQISETPPEFQTPITPPSTPTQHRQRGRLSGPLLKQILAPVIQPLPEFKFSEDDIKIVSVISTGAHSTVLRILASGKFYALKIHCYDRDAPLEPEDINAYPRPNSYFTAESNVYANLTSRPSIHGLTTPKCHGFINLTRIPIPPQSANVPARHRFATQNGTPALYRDYITHPERPRVSMPSLIWRSYFKHAPAGSIVLRGLVMTEIEPLHYLSSAALASPRRSLRAVAAKGTKALKALHACGILHGDIEKADSVMITHVNEKDGQGDKGKDRREDSDDLVIMGFGCAKTTKDYGPLMFRKAAKMEIRAWEGRWECMKVKCQARCTERGRGAREDGAAVGGGSVVPS
ncbi:hypothetical protein IFR05_007611 [Cadophora sp. M221]|nr:hypothetical protein IFR05_007611 [Cadophora sp. M221]